MTNEEFASLKKKEEMVDRILQLERALLLTWVKKMGSSTEPVGYYCGLCRNGSPRLHIISLASSPNRIEHSPECIMLTIDKDGKWKTPA